MATSASTDRSAPRPRAPLAALPARAAAGLAALLIALSPGAALGPARALHADPLNRIVLRVNDQIATLYDYQRRRADAEREVMRRVQDPAERRQELDQVGENVFRDLFQDLLLTSRADQLGIETTDQEIDQQVADMRERAGIKTDEEFHSALQQYGMTLEQLRGQARRASRMHEVMAKEVTSKIKVKEEDLRRFYRKNEDSFRVPEQVQLREVVVLDDSGLPDGDRGRLAAEIRAAAAAGKSLADVAAPFAAKHQTSAVVELGWVSPKDLDPKLEAAAWKLQKGAVTEPVQGRGGLHLLQLIDRKPAHLRPFAEVQAAIQRQEQERLFREESAKYLAELESKSLVVADPPQEAAGFRRKIGAPEDEAMKGLATAGAATGVTTAAPAAGQPAGDLTDSHLGSVDASDRKKGGLPAAQPVGAPQREPVTIPPPSNIPPPPAPTPPPPPSPPPGR